MSFFARLFRLIWAVLWYSFALVTVLVAATFGLARLLLPMAEQYSTDVETQASAFVGQPVKVRSLDAEWHGFGPSLVLKGVRVLDRNGKGAIMQFSRARLGLDLLSSLLQQQVSFSSLTLIGADLSFVRHADGHISLSDFNLQSQTDADNELADDTFVSRWFLGQGLLSLEVKNLLFEDRMNENRLFHFSNASIMLRNSSDLHLVDAILSLPEDPKHQLSLSLQVNGNPFEGTDWQAGFYMAGKGVNFRKMLGVQTIAHRLVSMGESDFKFWGQWGNGGMQSLQGEFLAQDISLALAPDFKQGVTSAVPAVPGTPVAGNAAAATKPGKAVRRNQAAPDKDAHIDYKKLSGRFVWQRKGQGWELHGDRLLVSHARKAWPVTEFDVGYVIDPQGKQQILASSSFLRIQDIAALRPLAIIDNAMVEQKLQQLKPRGDLHNISFSWREDQPEAFLFKAELKDAGTSAWEKIPGIESASGALSLQYKSGQMHFDTKDAVINMPGLFRQAHAIRNLLGEVRWSFSDEALHVETDQLVLNTPDIDTRLMLDLQIPATDQSPFMMLVADFKNGNGSQVSKYLPAKIMTENTVAWLDSAIVGGNVTSGGVLFHGETRDFPFARKQGVFEVRFDLDNGTLNYVKDWPIIENIKAEVVFRDQGMSITSDNATIFRSDLSAVKVTIPDLRAKPVKLGISGNVSGTTQEKIWYVQSSPPLATSFGHYFNDVTVRGDSDLSLDIGIDISDKVEAKVSGLLSLSGNDVDIKSLGEVFTNARGRLQIKPGGLKAQALSVDLFGQPTRVDIDTVPTKGKVPGSEITITGKGDFDARDLSQRYAVAIAELVEGKAPWDVLVTIPYQQADLQNSSGIKVAVNTELKGVALKLPAPFKKEKQTAISLQADMLLQANQHSVLTVSMDRLFNSIVETERVDQGIAYRGEIRFGGGPVVIPEQSGIQLKGHLPELNTDIWRNLVTQISVDSLAHGEAAAAFDPRMNCCAWMRGADLSISKMVAYGQSISDMKLTATNDGKNVSLTLKSNELTGKALIPGNLQRFPIELDLDYWHLIEAESAGEGGMDPRDIPAIKAFSKEVTYQNRKFGSVRLETTRLAEGLRLEQLVVKPRATTITAQGKWVIEGGQQKSEFALQLNSTDLGLTMDDLDYAGSISGGEGTVNATIFWPGSLTTLDRNHLQGHVNLAFARGRLLEVEAGGAGRRIFGLFSLRALPRRLILDFTDLFDKGFEFDEIKGDFNITQGDAYTTNFALSGPGVDAEISGRIGLATQDYDQQVKITPHVSDVTSLLTLLSSEPLLFLLQQLLKDKINQAASFEYHLTGPWDNYVLEPINRPEPDVFEDDNNDA